MKIESLTFHFHGVLYNLLMIVRRELSSVIEKALRRSRIVCLIGPRQCGKTTLAREYVAPDTLNYFDLEDPTSLTRLDQPMTTLGPLQGLVVIDEVQRRPELFPALRVLADRKPLPARFLILGSASPELLRQSTETLAGRLALIEMNGFSLAEVKAASQPAHWLRGGFPESYLSENDEESFLWRRDFVQTFLERDLPQWGIDAPAPTLMRFWTMLAHYHGQIWNAADLASSMGVSQPTVRRYLDILSGVFMVRQLQPWHANVKKRQVKSPKIYLRDSGLLHALYRVRTRDELLMSPRLGASWEGYVIEEAIRATEPDEACFWATHNGAEIDLVLRKHNTLRGVECKRVDAPRLTPSMRIAMEDLGLERLAVIYPGSLRYSLADNVEAVPIEAMAEGEKGVFP